MVFVRVLIKVYFVKIKERILSFPLSRITVNREFRGNHFNSLHPWSEETVVEAHLNTKSIE